MPECARSLGSRCSAGGSGGQARRRRQGRRRAGSTSFPVRPSGHDAPGSARRCSLNRLVMGDAYTTRRASIAKGFTDRLKAGQIMVADGATGTNYQQMGLGIGVAPEDWVFDEPGKVLALHAAFVDAGADIILTDTFGGTSLRLRESGYPDRAAELNRVAARLARQAAATREGVLVAGSMGPTDR